MIIRSFIVLSALLLLPQIGWAQLEVDFSNYDVPLYAQIVNRIKAKVSARLGEGRNPHDRYFIIPFAYQNRANDPRFSHSFITVIRVFADNKEAKLTPGLKTRTVQKPPVRSLYHQLAPARFYTPSEPVRF